jgi:hypothetical protein
LDEEDLNVNMPTQDADYSSSSEDNEPRSRGDRPRDETERFDY